MGLFYHTTHGFRKCYIVGELTAAADEITVKQLENYLFRLSILRFAAEMDGVSKAALDGMAAFDKSLSETIGFFHALPAQEPEKKPQTAIGNAGFQGNILLFYTRGEMEKANLNDAESAPFKKICEKINRFIGLAHSAAGEAAEIAEMLIEISNDLVSVANQMSSHGGAFKFIANEFENCANYLKQSAL